MAGPKTKREYLTKGLTYATQGQARYPECTLLEALCRHAEDRSDILTPSTVRSYKRQYATAAVKLCRDAGFGGPELRDALTRILNALNAITGTPPEPRTSSKKVKDPRDWMVKEVFGHLKIMAVRHRRIRSAACALYCLLVPKLGPRPVELTQAWIKDSTLFIPSAKQPQNQPAIREIDISDFHPTHREALLALIYIVDRDVQAGGYDAWLSRLAETLARACETVTRKTGQVIDRLSPSSFRHTAISTWHAAGYTAEEIAELVGHRDLRSQNAYKRTGSAWPVTRDLARPVAQVRRLEPNGPGPEGSEPISAEEVTGNPDASINSIDLDDEPAPKITPQNSIGRDLWRSEVRKIEAKLDRLPSLDHTLIDDFGDDKAKGPFGKQG